MLGILAGGLRTGPGCTRVPPCAGLVAALSRAACVLSHSHSQNHMRSGDRCTDSLLVECSPGMMHLVT